MAGVACAGGVEGAELDLVAEAVGDPVHGVAGGGVGAAVDAPPAAPVGYADGFFSELVFDDGAVGGVFPAQRDGPVSADSCEAPRRGWHCRRRGGRGAGQGW